MPAKTPVPFPDDVANDPRLGAGRSVWRAARAAAAHRDHVRAAVDSARRLGTVGLRPSPYAATEGIHHVTALVPTLQLLGMLGACGLTIDHCRLVEPTATRPDWWREREEAQRLGEDAIALRLVFPVTVLDEGPLEWWGRNGVLQQTSKLDADWLRFRLGLDQTNRLTLEARELAPRLEWIVGSSRATAIARRGIERRCPPGPARDALLAKVVVPGVSWSVTELDHAR